MILLFIITILLAALTISFFINKDLKALGYVAICASFLELIGTFAIVVSVINNGSYSLNDYFSVDALGATIMSLLAIAGFIVSFFSLGYLKIELENKIIGPNRIRKYFIQLHLFILAMFLAIMSTSPIFTFVAIQATTLSTAFLISFYDSPSSMEAAWKYLIVNSIGLLLGFFGTLLFLYPTVHGGFQSVINWQALLSNASSYDPFIIKIAFVFVLIGFGTKAGLAPMHTWLPDAHSKAPTPISGLLSGVLLNVAFLVILRFKAVIDLAIGKEFSGGLLIFFGLFSILIAAFIIFTQKSYKRMLAYSSIEHMGIAALGFGIGGAGAFAALLHIIYHSLAKTTMFLAAGNIFLRYKSTKIKNVKGLLSVLPITGVLFILGFLTITGVPPFGIFITEFSILLAGIKSHPVAVIIALFGIALVFIGFLQHIASMAFGENKIPVNKGENGLLTTVPIIILVTILIILSFFVPAALQSLLHSATINY